MPAAQERDVDRQGCRGAGGGLSAHCPDAKLFISRHTLLKLYKPVSSRSFGDVNLEKSCAGTGGHRDSEGGYAGATGAARRQHEVGGSLWAVGGDVADALLSRSDAGPDQEASL